MNTMKHSNHPESFPAGYRAEHLLNAVSQLLEIIQCSVSRNIRKCEVFLEVHT